MSRGSPRSRGDSAGHARDYSQYLDPEGLRGARIGVPRTVYWGNSEKSNAIAETALTLMRQLGAEVIDPADIPTAEAMLEEPGEMEVLLYEFKHDLNAHLAEREDPAIRGLEDLIRFNEEHAAEELRYFGQEHFLRAQERTADGFHLPRYPGQESSPCPPARNQCCDGDLPARRTHDADTGAAMGH